MLAGLFLSYASARTALRIARSTSARAAASTSNSTPRAVARAARCAPPEAPETPDAPESRARGDAETGRLLAGRRAPALGRAVTPNKGVQEESENTLRRAVAADALGAAP